MSMEHAIWIAMAAFVIVSIFYIPKDKYRLALISFLAFQALMWVAIIILTQIDFFEFPVREFPRATKVGLIMDFMFFPMIYAWSVLLSLNISSFIRKIIHNFIFISIIVWFILFISTYTEIENLKKGTFVYQSMQFYINFIFHFTICNIYVSWFSKKANWKLERCNNVSN